MHKLLPNFFCPKSLWVPWKTILGPPPLLIVNVNFFSWIICIDVLAIDNDEMTDEEI